MPQKMVILVEAIYMEYVTALLEYFKAFVSSHGQIVYTSYGIYQLEIRSAYWERHLTF